MWGIRNCAAGNKESPAGAGQTSASEAFHVLRIFFYAFLEFIRQNLNPAFPKCLRKRRKFFAWDCNFSYERRRILIFTVTTYGLIKFYMLKAFFEIFKCCLGVILTSIKYCRVQIEPSYMAVCNTAPPITENRFIPRSVRTISSVRRKQNPRCGRCICRSRC